MEVKGIVLGAQTRAGISIAAKDIAIIDHRFDEVAPIVGGGYVKAVVTAADPISGRYPARSACLSTWPV